MDAELGTSPERSIGDLFGQLAADGRAFVRAEAGLYGAIARRRAGKAAGGVAALVAAVFLLNAALVTLLVCVAWAIEPFVGPLAAGLITFAVIGIVAFLLVRYGLGKMKALSGDSEERAALALGETLP